MSQIIGIGLRQPHYRELLNTLPDIAWVELHSENFFAKGGVSLFLLEKIASHYPISLHGVGLSLGSSDKLSKTHLKKIKNLIVKFNPILVSEHLSFSSVGQVFMNDLLPIVYNVESFNLLVAKIDYVQQYFGREILIENPSTYMQYKDSTMLECDFLNNLAAKTNCGILLDVNNLYVNHINHNIDTDLYIKTLNSSYIKEIHLSGHSKLPNSNLLIDTHDNYVCEEVWNLYEQTLKSHGVKPTLLEWDSDLPSLTNLISEAKKSQMIIDRIGEKYVA